MENLYSLCWDVLKEDVLVCCVELRSETCRLMLPFLATWLTRNPSMGEGVGQLSRSQGYDWSAAHMKLLLYGCKPVNISTTVWDDF